MDLQNFVAVLKTHLDQETPNYQDGDAESLLEMRYNVYSEFNGFDNDLIRRDFDLLYESMNGKSLQEIDRIIYPICSLCLDHEKSGFVWGVKPGMSLARELDNF